MSKRNPPSRPARPRPAQPKPAWRPEGNSGEGAASALAILQKMEKRRDAAQPAEPRTGDEPTP